MAKGPDLRQDKMTYYIFWPTSTKPQALLLLLLLLFIYLFFLIIIILTNITTATDFQTRSSQIPVGDPEKEIE